MIETGGVVVELVSIALIVVAGLVGYGVGRMPGAGRDLELDPSLRRLGAVVDRRPSSRRR